MKLSEMTNEQIADKIEQTYCASSSEFGLTMREAAARLRKQGEIIKMAHVETRIAAGLRRRLKVAEDALDKIFKLVFVDCEVAMVAKNALAAIREEGDES